MTRVLDDDVAATALARGALPPDEVLAGTPTTGVLALDVVAGAEVGIWEMTAGTARDTEVDEVFIVIAGRGSVRFEDGEVVGLSPGVAVRLRAGERTEWSITETLRKVYVAGP